MQLDEPSGMKLGLCFYQWENHGCLLNILSYLVYTVVGVTHLVVHGTSCSTSYETFPPVPLETSRGVLSTVDKVVQRRDGPRRLCDDDDDEPRSTNHILCTHNYGYEFVFSLFGPPCILDMTTGFQGIESHDYRARSKVSAKCAMRISISVSYEYWMMAVVVGFRCNFISCELAQWGVGVVWPRPVAAVESNTYGHGYVAGLTSVLGRGQFC